MTAVRLQLAHLDLDADDVVARIGASETLRNLGWKTISGIVTMTVFTDSDVVADATTAIRCARNNGFTVLRVYEDRVNVGGIARRVGNISREAVRKWTLDDTFPPARTADLSARGTELVWDWTDVANWLVEHKNLDVDNDLPTSKQVAAIDAFIQGVHDYTSDGFHLVLRTPTKPVKAERYTPRSVKVSNLGMGSVGTTSTRQAEREFA